MSDLPVDETGLSIVIPAWNEERRLGETLHRYLPALESSGVPFEVIVVTDGVKDRTLEVAGLFAHRHVRTLEFPNRLGKGGAILKGVQASGYNIVGFLDADGPILPQDILSLVESLHEFECVIASRRVPGSIILEPEPLFRRLVGGVWGSLVRSVLFIPIRDTQCGAKFFRRASLMPILKRVAVTNWAFDVSLLYHFAITGRTILEQPVTWSHSPGSRLIVTRAIPTMLASLIGLRLMTLPITRRIPPEWISKLAQGLGAA